MKITLDFEDGKPMVTLETTEGLRRLPDKLSERIFAEAVEAVTEKMVEGTVERPEVPRGLFGNKTPI